MSSFTEKIRFLLPPLNTAAGYAALLYGVISFAIQVLYAPFITFFVDFSSRHLDISWNEFLIAQIVYGVWNSTNEYYFGHQTDCEDAAAAAAAAEKNSDSSRQTAPAAVAVAVLVSTSGDSTTAAPTPTAEDLGSSPSSLPPRLQSADRRLKRIQEWGLMWSSAFLVLWLPLCRILEAYLPVRIPNVVVYTATLVLYGGCFAYVSVQHRALLVDIASGDTERQQCTLWSSVLGGVGSLSVVAASAAYSTLGSGDGTSGQVVDPDEGQRARFRWVATVTLIAAIAAILFYNVVGVIAAEWKTLKMSELRAAAAAAAAGVDTSMVTTMRAEGGGDEKDTAIVSVAGAGGGGISSSLQQQHQQQLLQRFAATTVGSGSGAAAADESRSIAAATAVAGTSSSSSPFALSSPTTGEFDLSREIAEIQSPLMSPKRSVGNTSNSPGLVFPEQQQQLGLFAKLRHISSSPPMRTIYIVWLLQELCCYVLTTFLISAVTEIVEWVRKAQQQHQFLLVSQQQQQQEHHHSSRHHRHQQIHNHHHMDNDDLAALSAAPSSPPLTFFLFDSLSGETWITLSIAVSFIIPQIVLVFLLPMVRKHSLDFVLTQLLRARVVLGLVAVWCFCKVPMSAGPVAMILSLLSLRLVTECICRLQPLVLAALCDSSTTTSSTESSSSSSAVSGAAAAAATTTASIMGAASLGSKPSQSIAPLLGYALLREISTSRGNSNGSTTSMPVDPQRILYLYGSLVGVATVPTALFSLAAWLAWPLPGVGRKTNAAKEV